MFFLYHKLVSTNMLHQEARTSSFGGYDMTTSAVEKMKEIFTSRFTLMSPIGWLQCWVFAGSGSETGKSQPRLSCNLIKRICAACHWWYRLQISLDHGPHGFNWFEGMMSTWWKCFFYLRTVFLVLHLKHFPLLSTYNNNSSWFHACPGILQGFLVQRSFLKHL